MTKHKLFSRWSAAGLAAMLVCGASLAGSAATPEDKLPLEAQLKRMGYTLGNPVTSVANYRLDGFEYVNPRYVLFTADAKTAYLLKLRIRCQELAGSDGISITSNNSRVTLFDSVTSPTTAGVAPRNCPIEAITELGRIPRRLVKEG